MESTGRIGEPLDCFERTGTGERWSSTKSLQFQSDARATNLASAVRFVYQQNLTAAQSTAGDMLRVWHADASSRCLIILCSCAHRRCETGLLPIETLVQVRLRRPFLSWICGTNDNVTAARTSLTSPVRLRWVSSSECPPDFRARRTPNQGFRYECGQAAV